MFKKKGFKLARVMMVVMLMVVAVLSACGAKNNATPEVSEVPSPSPSPSAAESASPASNKLVVYAALNEDDIVQLSKKFTEDTGIEVEYLRLGNAGEASTRIMAEKANPQADIFVGGSVEFYEPLAKEGILENYVSSNAKDLDSQFNDPNGFWQGWYMGVLGIVLNTDRFAKELEPKGVKEPTTWDDLLDPAYKDVFVTSNPATAGGGYIFVADQLFRLGEEKGWEYLTNLNKNVHHYTKAAGDGINLTATGEFVAGMSWAHDIVKSAKQGYPIKVIVPKQTAFEIGGVGIIKNGGNTENAKKFVDWLLTKEIGELNTQISNRYSVRKDVAPPDGMVKIEDVDLVAYDRTKAAEMKTATVEKFTELTANK